MIYLGTYMVEVLDQNLCAFYRSHYKQVSPLTALASIEHVRATGIQLVKLVWVYQEVLLLRIYVGLK